MQSQGLVQHDGKGIPNSRFGRCVGLQVVDDGTNWRGRAQKIVMLKAKVRELQGRLQDQGPRSDVDGRARAELQVTCHSSCADAPPS